MKKTSLLSILWLAGLLAFVATPSFAQEAEDVADVDAAVVEETVDEAEDVVAEAEDVAAEPSLEEAITSDSELVDQLNQGMDQVLDSIEMTDEERAEFEAQFANPEERAVAMAGVSAIIAGAGLIYGIGALICWIIYVIALWFVFKKAGEKGWKAIIPIYDEYITYKIAGMKNWFWYSIIIAVVFWLIAAFAQDYKDILTNVAIAVCGIITIVRNYKLARKFNWSVFTSVLFVLFTWICMLILWFGGSKYQGEKAE